MDWGIDCPRILVALHNRLTGQVPRSMLNLVNLEDCELQGNSGLTCPFEFDFWDEDAEEDGDGVGSEDEDEDWEDQ
ncbi:hypothetical protein HDU98_006790 [Podochytrium sp. JEL0797]|nr:hypothetical protein HDU98_006790 [Podochytrium sp. JEL0797]